MKKQIREEKETLNEMVKQDCGCVENRKTVVDGPYVTSVGTNIKMCKEHKRMQKEREKAAKAFAKFPNKKSKKVYEKLDDMINKLYEEGVDVSYFPSGANRVLKDYAIKIAKIR